MHKLKSSFVAKAIAVVLVVISIFAFVAALVGLFIMDSAGIYRHDISELLKEGYDAVCQNYSIAALADYEGDFNEELLKGTNFRYGIVKADDIDAVDLLKGRTYVKHNFNSPLTETIGGEKLYIFSCDINKDKTQEFVYGSNIWDDFAIYDESEGYRTMEYPIEGYYYDCTEETVYVRSGKKLFDFQADQVSSTDNILQELNNDCMEYNGTYRWNDAYKEVVSAYGIVDLRDIRIVTGSELAKLGEKTGYDYMDGSTVYVTAEYHPQTERYYVVSTAQSPLQGKRSIWGGDMFMQTFLILRFLYHMRVAVIVILFVSLFVLAGSFVFLMSAAGHHKCQEGICPVFLDKAPLDLYFAGVCLIEWNMVCLFLSISGWKPWLESMEHVWFWVLSAGIGIISILAGLAYCMSLAVNIKLGKWWRRTAVYWICRKCIAWIRKCLSFCLQIVVSVCRSISLSWKICLVLGVLALLEFLLITASAYDLRALLSFWFLEKIIVYPCILFLLMQMIRLQKGAQRIAGGELDHRIDTEHMLWELKNHGQCLNDIGTGMNAAVNERLKSERFKTELITNVSHDIKTPLTSIINYVDLLQKERIDNPAAQEYLEVLSRQSARLKKLIEDLIEASKASTGSISVIMEQCDAGVMLVQTVGEYEEKLMDDQIMLQIKKPEESILIEADSRHLWRVFDNMMNNICKYSQPMTRAYVNLEQNRQQAVITFRNISHYPLNVSSEELMERFVRGDSSRNTEGNGLGISIAKSLTELMNGTFELIVDGDLFKVILSFPLYGKRQPVQGGSQADTSEADGPTGGSQLDQVQPGGVPDREERLRRDIKKADLAAGLQNAGVRVKGIGYGAAGRAGQMIRHMGRFAHNIKWAAQQTKAEAAEAGSMPEPAMGSEPECKPGRDQDRDAGSESGYFQSNYPKAVQQDTSDRNVNK